MNVLGVITARGGSKGIPKKNLAMLCGKPLLWWTVDVAKKARKLSRLIISTDCDEIANYAASLGVEVPFMRPPALGRDDTPTVAVLQHAIAECPGFSAVCTLQPTNPLRLASDIDGAIELMERTGCTSVVGYSDVGERHPQRMAMIEADGTVMPFMQDSFRRRQELRPVYLRNGAVYLATVETILSGSMTGSDCRAWIIPSDRCVNIDVRIDLKIAEAMKKFYELMRDFDVCPYCGRKHDIPEWCSVDCECGAYWLADEDAGGNPTGGWYNDRR